MNALDAKAQGALVRALTRDPHYREQVARARRERLFADTFFGFPEVEELAELLNDAHELVARGAALLDAKLPGWADQIDLERLDIEDGCNCVLGQLGKYQVNLDALGWHGIDQRCDPYIRMVDSDGLRMSPTTAVQYGFDDLASAPQVRFDELRDAWKGEIVARWTV